MRCKLKRGLIMKRIIAVILAIIMVFSLAACGEEKKVDISTAEIGEYITFGGIEWLVLKKTSDSILVVSKCAVAQRPYNDEDEDTTWATCKLRSWLNNEFINEEFTESERERILTVTVTAASNSRYATNGGIDTEDKLFLLSPDEAKQYLYLDDESVHDDVWWLRTPGSFQNYAAVVEYGNVDLYGEEVYSAYYSYESGNFDGSINNAVRPAMWIEIGS